MAKECFEVCPHCQNHCRHESIFGCILQPGAETEASFTGSRLPPPVRNSARQGQSRIQPSAGFWYSGHVANFVSRAVWDKLISSDTPCIDLDLAETPESYQAPLVTQLSDQ